MKKHILTVLTISLLLVFLIICVLFYSCYKTWFLPPLESKDINEYSNNLIVVNDQEYGQQVSMLLPEPKTLKNYIKVDYLHVDAQNKDNFLHEYFTTYTLDIYYSSQQYAEEKNNFINSYSNKTVCDKNIYFTNSNTANVKGVVAFFDDDSLMRYYIICNDSEFDITEFKSISAWNDGIW